MSYWEDETKRCTYSAPDDRYVCPGCVTDGYLASLLEAALEDEPCSYCGAAKAAAIYVLCDEIATTIEAYYTDPAMVLGYDSGEGGYQGEVLTGSEVIEELDPWTECDELLDEVSAAFACDTWCKRDYYGLDHYETLDYGWQSFSEQVKHRTRYLFLQELDADREYREYSGMLSPGEMLDTLGNLFLEFDLFYELSQATDLFRVREFSEGPRPETASELGTAPRKLARRPNRMSPAGIPMFYAAFDEVTAVLETYDPTADTDSEIALARFQNKRPLMLLNLTDLPEVPSIFDLRKRYEYPRIAFLRSFEREFTKPVERKTEGHTEYVPTQVVTEFVRHRLRTAAGKPVDGIIYRSSRTRTTNAIVIFADPEHCGPRSDETPFNSDPFLELISVRYGTYDEFKKHLVLARLEDAALTSLDWSE